MMKIRTPEKHSHTGYCRNTRGLTIELQEIRNDDESLSPIFPLVCLLFLSFLIHTDIDLKQF